MSNFIIRIYQCFVNWSDSLTDVVCVLFFRGSLCRYFTAFLMGRWVNDDECNFMDGQNWKMTINTQAFSTAISPRHPICSLTSKPIIMWEAIYTDSLTHKHQEKLSYLLAPCKLLSLNGAMFITYRMPLQYHLTHLSFPLVISLFCVQTE